MMTKEEKEALLQEARIRYKDAKEFSSAHKGDTCQFKGVNRIQEDYPNPNDIIIWNDNMGWLYKNGKWATIIKSVVPEEVSFPIFN